MYSRLEKAQGALPATPAAPDLAVLLPNSPADEVDNFEAVAWA
jgi:hypothetical protein